MLDARWLRPGVYALVGLRTALGGGGAPLRQGYPCGEKIIAECAAPLRTPLKGGSASGAVAQHGVCATLVRHLEKWRKPNKHGHFSHRGNPIFHLLEQQVAQTQ